MKKILLLLLIVCSGTITNAQSNSVLTKLNGKYGFIYNDHKRMVELISSSNTFIEYDETGNQVTDGSFIKKGDTYYLTPIVTSNQSEIDIPVNFKVLKELPKKFIVVFNSAEVKSKSLDLFKL